MYIDSSCVNYVLTKTSKQVYSFCDFCCFSLLFVIARLELFLFYCDGISAPIIMINLLLWLLLLLILWLWLCLLLWLLLIFLLFFVNIIIIIINLFSPILSFLMLWWQTGLVLHLTHAISDHLALRPVLLGNDVDHFYSSLTDEKKMSLKRDILSYPKVNYSSPLFSQRLSALVSGRVSRFRFWI